MNIQTEQIPGLPEFQIFKPVLQFDMEQFYTCNRHSELMTRIPQVRNLRESKALGPFNMGIVAAGTIDLMALSGLNLQELGRLREIFHLGQRLGRISNLLVTFDREFQEGDITNEILIAAETQGVEVKSYQDQLCDEFSRTREVICSSNVESFSSMEYAKGFNHLNDLHLSLRGQI